MLFYFCVICSLLPLKILYFLCYVDVSLDSELERPFFERKKKKKISKIFHSILCPMGKCRLFLSTNLFYFLIILIHHFLLFFSIFIQKKKCQKEKQYSVKLHDFFMFYVGWTYVLKGSLFIKVVSQLI